MNCSEATTAGAASVIEGVTFEVSKGGVEPAVGSSLPSYVTHWAEAAKLVPKESKPPNAKALAVIPSLLEKEGEKGSKDFLMVNCLFVWFVRIALFFPPATLGRKFTKRLVYRRDIK